MKYERLKVKIAQARCLKIENWESKLYFPSKDLIESVSFQPVKIFVL